LKAKHTEKRYADLTEYRPVIIGREVISKKVKDDKEDDVNLDDLDGPLGSDDDDDLSDPEVVDDTLICQFEKINRTKDVFHLKLHSGVLNVNGKEYSFASSEVGSVKW
jgi:hypothetical protein